MARVKRGVAAHAKHKKTLDAIDGLNKAGIELDRKVLSDLAIREPAAFAAIVEQAKAALPA